MLKPPWRFGAEVPQRIVPLVLKWSGRFGTGTLGGLGSAKLGLAADWAPRSRGSRLFRRFSPEGIRGNDNGGRGGESRWLHQAYSAQRDLPNGSRQGGMARFARQKPPSAIRFARWSHQAWPDSPGEAIERDGIRPAGSVEHGKICPVESVMHGKSRSPCMI